MKKMIAIVSLGSFLVASQMPPMPPMVPNLQKAKKSSTKKEKKLPKECEMLPPMIYRLPPPMEEMLDKCKNRLYLPTKQKASKALGKVLHKKVKVLDIKAAKDFDMLYKITTKKRVYFCNKSISACIEGKRVK